MRVGGGRTGPLCWGAHRTKGPAAGYAVCHAGVSLFDMDGVLLWVANLVSGISPQTRCFGLRGVVYRAAGVQVAATARLNGLVRIHHPNVTIGPETWLGAGAQLIPTAVSHIRIGSRCDIGPDVMFVTGSHEQGDGNRRAGRGFSAGISVGDGTWVGARATFLAGSSVGKGCMVAAGALVRDTFPDNVLIAGVPARVVRQLSHEASAS